MSRYLDTDSWARRDAFEFFRGFDKPYFNVCVRLDVAPLKAALVARGTTGGLSLACYFVALRLANLHQPFRLRLEQGRVRVFDEVHGSTTVLRADGESFFFADLKHTTDFDTFVERSSAAIEAARTLHASFEPRPEDIGCVYFTSLPWLHFSSFSHARNWKREDSIPRLAFGRAQAEGARLWLPMSVEVHHALMDGVHLGRYVQEFEDWLAQPQRWLATHA